MGGDKGKDDATVGVVSESGALLFYCLCILGQWLNSLFLACGTVRRLVQAEDIEMSGSVPSYAGGPVI